VRDVWTFRSGGTHPAVPLLTPHYLPPLSRNGDLAPGPTVFRLGFRSLTRHEHHIVEAHLQLSSNDGRSWHGAHLKRLSSTTFRVAYRNPGAHGHARFMSMRVRARDGHGDRIKETAMRIYRLR
jgi:hypothetical protein